jgi:hypothetical protein
MEFQVQEGIQGDPFGKINFICPELVPAVQPGEIRCIDQLCDPSLPAAPYLFTQKVIKVLLIGGPFLDHSPVSQI